jgi:IS5 family transposase
MLITTNPQLTLWETVLPPGYQDLPKQLAAVDALLDDPVFFQPYRAHFSADFGRPSIPIETYLRMMFLKHHYRLGYETLCREVADSLSWSRFCRVPLGCTVPHPSTLEKITTRCGPETIAQLNRALLVKAGAAKVVRLDKVRADTTVVAANVAYPTDSGLLVRAITLLTMLVALIHTAGGAARTTVRDRRRTAGRRARSISAHLKLRNDEAKTRVLAITGELADLAEATAGEASKVLVNARRGIAHHGGQACGRLVAAVTELEIILGRTGQVITQTRSRLGGVMPASATRLVSLHDPDARAIAKGRLGKPVEFGYKGQVVDNVDGIVLDHSVHLGNPPDAPLLAPAIGRIQNLFDRAVRAVTADRGYGEAKIDQELRDLGVKTVVIPRKGKPSAARRELEHGRGFQRLVKWRTGSEGRISYLKRRYGFRPHPVRHPGRRADLVRARRARPQQCQDRPPDPGPPTPTHPRRPTRSTPTGPASSAGTGRDRAATRSTVPPRRRLTPLPGRSGTPGRRLPPGRTPHPGPKRPRRPPTASAETPRPASPTVPSPPLRAESSPFSGRSNYG